MNTSLFRSKHGLIALVLVAAFLALALVTGSSFGREAGSVRGYLLGSGWTTLALMLVVMAYVLRKYAHRGRYSPEFRMRVKYEALERANNRIRALRARINDGSLGTKALIEAEARQILKSEKVHKVNRIQVDAGPPGGDPFVVRILPTEPLGRVSSWMHVHAFYGTAFGALLLMHGGLSPNSPFGWLLAGLGLWVLVTGLIGIVLWAKGPAWLTKAERDLSIEEANALHGSLKSKRKEALKGFQDQDRKDLEELLGKGMKDAAAVRGKLQALIGRDSSRKHDLQDLFALMGQEQAVGSELRKLRRVRSSFMGWKFAHIPAAVLLTGMVVVHVLSIWKY